MALGRQLSPSDPASVQLSSIHTTMHVFSLIPMVVRYLWYINTHGFPAYIDHYVSDCSPLHTTERHSLLATGLE